MPPASPPKDLFSHYAHSTHTGHACIPLAYTAVISTIYSSMELLTGVIKHRTGQWLMPRGARNLCQPSVALLSLCPLPPRLVSSASSPPARETTLGEATLHCPSTNTLSGKCQYCADTMPMPVPIPSPSSLPPIGQFPPSFDLPQHTQVTPFSHPPIPTIPLVATRALLYTL